ncbi:hypothetical protein SAMN04487897_103351 [Paenibacillus sp. yr247]|nr:hypothetical protein [Paenibacillus sp. yr247]SDN61675.1 hypothetical protein SAMN04487897_103351 [Paenibacillus sp. yr247]
MTLENEDLQECLGCGQKKEIYQFDLCEECFEKIKEEDNPLNERNHC